MISSCLSEASNLLRSTEVESGSRQQDIRGNRNPVDNRQDVAGQIVGVHLRASITENQT